MKFIKDLENGRKQYSNHRNEPYYEFVKNGTKTVEGRLLKGLYKEVAVRDYIEIQTVDESDSFFVEVVGLREYASFKEMLEKEEIQKVLPNVKTAEEGIEVYREFYTEEEEKEHGVIAIEVNRIY